MILNVLNIWTLKVQDICGIYSKIKGAQLTCFMSVLFYVLKSLNVVHMC